MRRTQIVKMIMTLILSFALMAGLAFTVSAEQSNLLPAAYQVYFSGIDNRGELIAESHSDANIIITVNTDTKQILLVHIPRDYCIEFASDPGFRDKITNCGLKGISNIVASVNRFMGLQMEYYVRIGFQGVIDFIDANGGLDVYSEYEFTTGNMKGYHFVEGINKMDGAAALAYARERYAYDSGDRQRGRNQMYLMKALVDSFSKGSVLENLQSFLTAMEGNFETNIPAAYLLSMGTAQVLDQDSWNIVMYSLDGTESSVNGEYVMEPDMATVEEAKSLIQKVMNGEILDQEADGSGTVTSKVTDFGDKELIMRVQAALNAAGYDCGEPDGIMGPNTEKAIYNYTVEHGISPTSSINYEIMNSLGISTD